VVTKYDAEDFALAELQTKKSFLEIKGRYRHEFEDYIWFMYHINLAVQKIVNEIRPAEVIESIESIAVPMVQSVSADDVHYSAMTRAASGQGNPESAIDASNELIEWADAPANVNITGIDHAAATVIQKAAYQGTYNAMARFQDPIEEVEIEKIHRLKNSGWSWENIVRELYPDTKEEDINSEINRLKMQHSREYGKPQKK